MASDLEDKAIPIATSQSKEWYDNASQSEINGYDKDGKPTKRSEKGKKYENNPERLEEGEHVVTHTDGWAVKSSDVKHPSDVFDNKDGSIKRAREIAKNKGTKLTVYKQDGSVQDKESF